MTDPATAWLVFVAALLLTLGFIAISCCMIADDLEDTLHELELDERWLDGDEWVEPA